MIRPAAPGDLTLVQAIERAAGEAFRAVGMEAVADDEPLSAEVLLAYQAAGRAWVWVDDDTALPGAYLVADVLDGAGHIDQVSVSPAYAGCRIGAALIDAAQDWACGQNLASLTLTTFRDVPWNRPYYERIGFEVVPEDEMTPGLVRVRRREAELGLDAWPRVAMRRLVPGGRSRGRVSTST